MSTSDRRSGCERAAGRHSMKGQPRNGNPDSGDHIADRGARFARCQRCSREEKPRKVNIHVSLELIRFCSYGSVRDTKTSQEETLL